MPADSGVSNQTVTTLTLALGDSRGEIRDGAGRQWGTTVHAALANDPSACLREALAGRRVLCWSAFTGDAMSDADPVSWRPEHWARFAAAVASADRQLAAAPTAGQLLIRTHARHVLSDLVRGRKFLAECATARVGLAIDIGSLFTRSMLRHAEDHAARMAEMIESMPGVAAVMVSNVCGEPAGAEGDIDDGPALPLSPRDRGVIPAAALSRIAGAARQIGAAIIECVE